jgi:voltage-gated potassium channel
MTNGPLTVLALLMVPVLLAPAVTRLAPSVERALLAVDYSIWAVFALDYLIRLWLAPRRLQFVRSHPLDLIVVVVPMLRPLRVLRSIRAVRLLRLSRLAAFAGTGLRQVRRILRTHGLNYVLLVVLALTFVAAGVVLELERASAEANIRTFGDALWWAFTTVTTVGYGDRYPTTVAGRGVAVFLMIAGISAFGVLTAAIAAFFVEQKKSEADEQTALLRQIAAHLGRSEQPPQQLSSPMPQGEPSREPAALSGYDDTDGASGKIWVGHIGEHLRTMRTN